MNHLWIVDIPVLWSDGLENNCGWRSLILGKVQINTQRLSGYRRCLGAKDDGFVSSLIPLCIPMWVCSHSPEISSLGELQLTKMWTKEKEKQSEIQGKNRTVKTDVQAEPKHQEAYCEVPLQQSWITNQSGQLPCKTVREPEGLWFTVWQVPVICKLLVCVVIFESLTCLNYFNR